MSTLGACRFLLFAILGLGGSALAAEAGAVHAFERLKALQGKWSGRFADRPLHFVDYRLSAGGSVLVETWQLASGRESMTLYHLDGDRLLATHYCPQGNQPRLVLVPGADPAVLSFEFVDGTGLQPADGRHQHAFTLVLSADGSYSRSETYVGNVRNETAPAAEPDAPVLYTREARVN